MGAIESKRPGDAAGQDGVVREVAVEELGQFCEGQAVIANDIAGATGSILISRGTSLMSVASSIAGLQKQLRNANVRSVRLLLPSGGSRDEVESLVRGIKPGIAPIDAELAHQTVNQVEDVLGRIQSGNCTPENVQDLADRGRVLAKQIAKAPQLMFCLGHVRDWDEYTSVHSLNVSLLSSFLADRMFPDRPEFAEFMAIGGILHDLGKAKVPHEVLNKPAKLTDAEFAVMKQHPTLGVQLAVESGVTDERTLTVIRGHHERYGGGGYPDSLDKKDLPIEARIAAVADVFDALTAKRVYKDPMPGRNAIELMTGAMAAHFDPAVMRVLLLAVGIYPAGTLVELSDGSVGAVIGTTGTDVVHPQVALRYDRFGKPVTDKTVVQTGSESGVLVVRSLQTNDKIGF
ncbi:HD-GYP domain-containing protein [uncultured Fretibacterium sp.]|uniref:HD-GYP domain-containing protein n=1 Tax=uncultured Fretibacterium sp. TaxID=1678694 RepID=UPI002603DF14|nr:HD-GYP domain-containing protein [uncultured Fretibacterium sp.]